MSRALNVLALLVLAGCPKPGAELEPAPAAKRVGADVAVDRVEDVYVETEVEAWTGDRDVLRYVTPVRVQIRNESERPIRVQYRDFTLVGPDGREHAAIPPHDVHPGEPEAPVSFLHPRFSYRGFGVDPIYDELFPELETNRYRLGYSIDYHDTYYPSWTGPLPTKRMQELGIPEGVLRPGGELDGILYFEKVGRRETGPVTLFYRLVDAGTGDRVGTVEIPFEARG